MDDDIAVVGIGCRFPGADNIDEFWRVLVNEENHIIDIPEERWNNAAFYSDDKDEPGKHYVKKAAFINHFDEWDNKLFGISDNEAGQMDPQQRYVLECTHMAMEDGGITRKQMNGSSTGVYIGAMGADYKTLFEFDHTESTNYTATGASGTILSSRVSYVYNLQGPCMVVDTACSSSMIAIHLGCQAIRTGDCEMAICGGVNNILSPGIFQTLSRAKMLSPTCQCQAFCDTADGYARGEGCGIVILKPFLKALQDRNKIWGIVQTGTNQDGYTAQPITAPSAVQQEKLLHKLYSQYNVDPSTLQYFECHGTGTPVGDPTELNAIGRFLTTFVSSNEDTSLRTSKRISNTTYTGRSTINYETGEADGNHYNSLPTDSLSNSNRKILIGSVKTNIGHLESAAGIAGLIKTLLMMKNGKFVPSLHVKKDKSNINRKIDFDRYGIEVALSVKDWCPNSEGKRVACVNSFGFGGSNSHAIVTQNNASFQAESDKETFDRYNVICVTSASKKALKLTMQTLDEDLSSGKFSLQDVSYTSVHHRDHYTYRTLLSGRNIDEVRTSLIQKIECMNIVERKNKCRIIFVFCGVGTTWEGMCREMMEVEPVFRNTVIKIDTILTKLLGWSISERFRTMTDYSDPLLNHVSLFCMQVALFQLWGSFGIVPDAIIGQSTGEVSAAYASGMLTLEGAIKVIYIRSTALASINMGKMIVVSNYKLEKIKQLCKKYKHNVEIAVYNSPKSCTLSGSSETIDKITRDLEVVNEKEKSCIRIMELSSPCGYHSHIVEQIASHVEKQLCEINTGKNTIDHYSTVTGYKSTHDEFKTGLYWSNNIRKPVKFMQALENSIQDDVMNVFVEIGPTPVLHYHVNDIFTSKDEVMCIPSMVKKNESKCLYSSLSTLFELGIEIDWTNMSSEGNLVPVLHYIQNRRRQLHIPLKHQAMLKGFDTFPDSHMFVKCNGVEKSKFLITFDQKSTPFVYDHLFSGTCIVPGATYIEAAIEIGQRIIKTSPYELNISAEFVCPLKAEIGRSLKADVILREQIGQTGFSYQITTDGNILSRGYIKKNTQKGIEKIDISPIKRRCAIYKTSDECYQYLKRMYFSYGKSLRIIKRTWSSETECFAEFELPTDIINTQSKQMNIHPGIIDGMFQMVVVIHHRAIENYHGDSPPFFPKEVASFILKRPVTGRIFAYARLMEKLKTGHTYNFLLVCPDGNVIAEIKDFFCRSMDKPEIKSTQSRCLRLEWCKLNLDNTSDLDKPTNTKDHCFVIGSNRFIKNFKKTEDNVNTLDLSWKPNITVCNDILPGILKATAVVFAPFQHVKDYDSDSLILFDISRHAMLSLSQIIKIMSENDCKCPLYIVTENVISDQKENSSTRNVLGAELWGMARSAVSEKAYIDICLVDMSVTSENIIALRRIMKKHTGNNNEYMIDRGNVYICEVLDLPLDERTSTRREMSNPFQYFQDIVKLKSEDWNCLKNPWYEIDTDKDEFQRNTKERCHVKVRLKAFSLHNPALYPICSVDDTSATDVWVNTNKGFQTTCLEYVGLITHEEENGQFKSSDEVVVCCPVDVKSYVYVPKEFTLEMEKLNMYIPGLLTEAVVIWNVLKRTKYNDDVTFIIDGERYAWKALLMHIFAMVKDTNLIIKQTDYLNSSEKNGTSTSQVIVLLSTLVQQHVERIPKHFPKLKQIISLNNSLPRSVKLWIEKHILECPIDVLNLEDFFHSQALKESLPIIFNILQSFKMCTSATLNSHFSNDVDREHNENLLTLPHESMQLSSFHNSTQSVNPIPLKVFQSDIVMKNACYVVVGGNTGLGLEITNHLAELGAGYIATFSRRPPSDETRIHIKSVEAKHNNKIIPVQCDVTDVQSVYQAFEYLQKAVDNVPIKGVFQGAGIRCDVLLKHMSEKDMNKTLAPKILGTWNLHFATLQMPLDFFVMQSSIVSIIGNQGQCSYAAGNSFMDSFARYRRSLGLCGQSINWSALSVGMASYDKNLQLYLENKGVYCLSKTEIKTCFLQALVENPVQIIFGRIDWRRLLKDPDSNMISKKYARIMEQNSPETTNVSESKRNILNTWTDLDPKHKLDALLDLVKTKVANTFVIEYSSLKQDTLFASLGIDSMIVMSFANSIFDATGVKISTGNMYAASATIGTITEYIMHQIEKISRESDKSGHKNVSAHENEETFFDGSITFMKQSILDDFDKDPKSPDLLRQVAWEYKEDKFSVDRFKHALAQVLRKNSDLRRIYRKQSNGSYNSIVQKIEEIDVDVKEIDYDSEEFTKDCRDKMSIDITREIPIVLKVAHKQGRTRVIMFLHGVVADLPGIMTIVKEISQFLSSSYESTCDVDSTFEPAEIVRTILKPRMNDLKKYWSNLLSEDIQPFSLGDIRLILDRNKWKNISSDLPSELVSGIKDYIHAENVTLYNFVTSVYFYLLNEIVGNDIIPLITNADMRIHMPQLRAGVTRCVNEIPVIGDLRRSKTTVRNYVKLSAANFNEMTEHSAYPYQLIEKEFQSEDLRRHIWRHRLIMNDMTAMNKVTQNYGLNEKDVHFFYKRHSYETALSVVYDMNEKIISLQFGYNSGVLSDNFAAQLSGRLITLLKLFSENPEMSLKEVRRKYPCSFENVR